MFAYGQVLPDKHFDHDIIEVEHAIGHTHTFIGNRNPAANGYSRSRRDNRGATQSRLTKLASNCNKRFIRVDRRPSLPKIGFVL